MMIPLFLFSLPRAGSTLAQRVLAAHEQIATISEPWILLPYLYSQKDRGIYAEYDHHTFILALEDFCRELPNGKEDYLTEIRELALRLYTKAAGKEAKYFLDKTPRYHLIVEDVIRLFPEGKFIFLWRNPLATAASIMEYWAQGRWNLSIHKLDLFDGLANLIAAYERHKSIAHAVRYEDLITNPEPEWRKIFTYLGLPYNPELFSRFAEVQLKGRMGDHSGTKRHQTLSQEPLNKWTRTMANPIRKAWCRRYLRWIGAERLNVMGYSLSELRTELDAAPTRLQRVGSDLCRAPLGMVFRALEPLIMLRMPNIFLHWYRSQGKT